MNNTENAVEAIASTVTAITLKARAINLLSQVPLWIVSAICAHQLGIQSLVITSTIGALFSATFAIFNAIDALKFIKKGKEAAEESDKT